MIKLFKLCEIIGLGENGKLNKQYAISYGRIYLGVILFVHFCVINDDMAGLLKATMSQRSS